MLDIKIKIHSDPHFSLPLPFTLTCHPSPQAEILLLQFVSLSTTTAGNFLSTPPASKKLTHSSSNNSNQ
jgi:hypothetical protein